MKEEDRTKAFGKFLDEVNQLLVDPKLREVLEELDAEGEEAFALLAPDPAAFLRYKGVKIPEDYKVAVEQRAERQAARTTVTYYCLRICWWRWCITICIVIVSRTSTAAELN